MKHWKHSKRTALAPFLRFDEILEQTESWQITRISASCLSKFVEYFLRVLKNFNMAT